jgi:Tfp pilus assembly protein PilF
MTQSAQGVSRRPLSSVAARMLARARREWGQQQFEAAEQSLTNVLRLAPDEPDAVRLLGMVVQRLGRHAQAIESFRQVLAMCPEDSDLRIGLGISLFEQGEAEEALMHFR